MTKAPHAEVGFWGTRYRDGQPTRGHWFAVVYPGDDPQNRASCPHKHRQPLTAARCAVSMMEGCTCRPCLVVVPRIYFAGIDDCPVHGFGPDMA